jgi:hypothetical protein
LILAGENFFRKIEGGGIRLLRRRKLVSAPAAVLFLLVVLMIISALIGTAETITPEVVYYDLPTYSQVNQFRTVQIQVSPYENADPLGNCILRITEPDGSTSDLTSSPNETGYVSFNYTPDMVGNYRINYFFFPGAQTSDDNYTSFNAPINHRWAVGEEADSTPPFGTILINDNEERTDSTSVTLTVSAEDASSAVTWMRFSNDETSWSPWERYTVFTPEPSYVTTRDWDLASGNGSKNVYVQFMNEAGLVSESFFDSIFLGTVKSQGSITCSTSKTTLKIGESAVISGQLSPALEGAAIVITGRAEGSTWATLGTALTSPNGVYSFTWSPAAKGTWEVMASWEGNADVSSCESQIQTVMVSSQLTSSSLYISLSKYTVTAGESVTISGFLSPPRNGARIIIQYQIGDEAWSTLQVVYSDAYGKYSYVWSPKSSGTCQLKVTWEGDAATAQCESQSLTLDIAKAAIIGPRELSIITLAVAAISTPIAGIAVYSWRQVLNRAQNVSEKLNKKLEEKKYGETIEELDKLNELIKKALSSGKLPKEINEPPYSLTENLESIKKNLSESIAEKTVDKVLQESEIGAYLSGVKCVLKTFQNSKDVKAPQREDSKSEFFVAFLSATTKVFDKVNRISKAAFKDFWFIWENDEYEPVRIFFDNGKAVRARFRWHWAHFDISNPYVDDKGRIEVFFLPQFHTPIIRRSKADVCFIVFAKCYCAMVHDYTVVLNEKINEYYTKSGWKKTHWPPINYPGW